MTRVAVVGAGISGLTVAYRLRQRLPEAEVVVLEQGDRPGGVIATVQRDGFVVEAGPNGFPSNNPCTLELARELGLQDALVTASESAGRNRYLLLDGRLRLLPNGLGSFLTSDLLSWVAKLRVLAERFRPRRTSPRDESIDAFVRRRVGGEVARTLADPFVTGILAGDPKLLSVQASFPRLVAWERDHGSITAGMAAARRGRLSRPATWAFHGGMQTLVDGLARAVQVRTGVAVTRIGRLGGQWVLEGTPSPGGRGGVFDTPGSAPLGAEATTRESAFLGASQSLSPGHPGHAHLLTADAVVLTCPAYRQADLVADLDADLADKLAGIAYNRVAVVALGFRREDVPHSLDGFGYLSPQRERRDVLGAQWCSSIFPGRAPDGTVLVRALCGGWHRGDVVDWDDERLVAAVRAELARAVGVRVAPVFRHVVRWPRAIPQYHLGHLDRVGWIDDRLTRHPGLYLGGSAFRGVAINDCVEQAGRLADTIAQRGRAGPSTG